MASNINLDGGEISIIKALGLSGGEITGEQLAMRVPELAAGELITTVKTLVMMGYVISDDSSLKKKDDFDKAHFHVNSGYAHELKEAIDPPERPKKSRRVRRE
jgi:hypothetical protein